MNVSDTVYFPTQDRIIKLLSLGVVQINANHTYLKDLGVVIPSIS